MSIQVQIQDENEVTIRAVSLDVPLHLCFETHGEIKKMRSSYLDRIALKVGEVLFVKNAP